MNNSDLSLTIITSKRTTWRQTYNDFFSYRHLLLILAWREISIRYKQTLLGAAWVLLQPITSALIFALIFGSLGKLPSEGLPYFVFAYCGMILWGQFAQGLDRAATSIVVDERLVSKVYFPRWIIPISAVLSTVPDLLIGLALAFILLLYFHLFAGWSILLLPLTIILAGFFTASTGLLIAGLNVRYRDFRYMIPFLLQSGLFLSPVLYSTSLVPEKFRWLLYLNPLTGLLEISRHALTGTGVVDWPHSLVSVGIALIIGLICIHFFHQLEDDIADVI